MKPPALSQKAKPSQTRSQDTFELIVETTGRLLEEIGVENLSTNLVCREAGITPPALYRYFPNKYAIMRELGDRLMQAQDEAAHEWLDAKAFVGESVDDRVVRLVSIHNRIISITRAFPGSIAISRALRAVPALKSVRIDSRDSVARRQAIALARMYPDIPANVLFTSSKMSIEMIYAAMELVLEEPSSEAQQIIEGACRAVILFMADLQKRYADATTQTRGASRPAPKVRRRAS